MSLYNASHVPHDQAASHGLNPQLFGVAGTAQGEGVGGKKVPGTKE